MSKQASIDIIRAFTEVTTETLGMMCSITAQAGKPYLKDPRATTYGVSGIIGIGGDMPGVLVITLPEAVALKVIGGFVGQAFDKISGLVIDGVREFTNIVMGSGSAKLAAKGYNLQFGLPKVVAGLNHFTDQGKGVNTIVVPFTVPGGAFQLEVTIGGPKVDE